PGAELQDPARGLAGARAELEDPLGAQPFRRTGRLLLEALVAGDLGVHRLEVALGLEAELAHAATIAATTLARRAPRLRLSARHRSCARASVHLRGGGGRRAGERRRGAARRSAAARRRRLARRRAAAGSRARPRGPCRRHAAARPRRARALARRLLPLRAGPRRPA